MWFSHAAQNQVEFKRLVEMISQNWKEKNRGPIINAVEEITLENIFFQRLNVIWELYSWHLNCIAWLSARETGHHFGSLPIMISSHICMLVIYSVYRLWYLCELYSIEFSAVSLICTFSTFLFKFRQKHYMEQFHFILVQLFLQQFLPGRIIGVILAEILRF